MGAGLSLRDLADLLTIDGQGTITHGHLGRIETGEREASQELANRIATAVGHALSGRKSA
jgi:transcriptional regulator with XRE-family HTH domain